MAFNVGMHVSDKYNQLALASIWKKANTIVAGRSELGDVHTIVNYMHFAGIETVFPHQSITDRNRIRHDGAAQILNPFQPNAPLTLIPLEMRQVATAGNNRRNARQTGRRNSDQIRPEIVRVNDVEAPEKPAHTQKLTKTGRTVNSVSRTKFANGDPSPLKAIFKRTLSFETADRYLVSCRG